MSIFFLPDENCQEYTPIFRHGKRCFLTRGTTKSLVSQVTNELDNCAPSSSFSGSWSVGCPGARCMVNPQREPGETARFMFIFPVIHLILCLIFGILFWDHRFFSCQVSRLRDARHSPKSRRCQRKLTISAGMLPRARPEGKFDPPASWPW